MTTLAAKILALNDGKRTTREIAELVYGKGCPEKRLAYVRVVLRQRKGSCSSENDRRYLESSLGQLKRAAERAAKKLLYLTGDREVARKAMRRAYKQARRNGASPIEASTISFQAYGQAMRKTGDLAEARKTYALARRQPGRADARECRT